MWRLYANIILLYVRHLSILGIGNWGAFWSQSPMDAEGQHYILNEKIMILFSITSYKQNVSQMVLQLRREL